LSALEVSISVLSQLYVCSPGFIMVALLVFSFSPSRFSALPMLCLFFSVFIIVVFCLMCASPSVMVVALAFPLVVWFHFRFSQLCVLFLQFNLCLSDV
jgi:predicted RND superfamily exporter protein